MLWRALAPEGDDVKFERAIVVCNAGCPHNKYFQVHHEIKHSGICNVRGESGNVPFDAS
jgi:hypothetical protein